MNESINDEFMKSFMLSIIITGQKSFWKTKDKRHATIKNENPSTIKIPQKANDPRKLKPWRLPLSISKYHMKISVVSYKCILLQGFSGYQRMSAT